MRFGKVLLPRRAADTTYAGTVSRPSLFPGTIAIGDIAL